MHHVHHIGTGGTIAFDGSAMLGAASLVDFLGVDAPEVRWSHEEADRIPSSWATPQSLAGLAACIDRAGRERRPDVVLVTHGTDTMEEAAMVADMVCGDDVPIVFTGAMRPGPEGDGPRNIADAIRAGSDPGPTDHGVAVVMHGAVHAATEVRKLHSGADDAFHSREPLGRIGRSDRDRIQWRGRSPHRLRLPHAEPRHTVRVIRLAAGDAGELVEEAVRRGVDGVVVELFGAGNAPHAVLDAIAQALDAGVRVAVTTRCGDGPVEPTRTDARLIVLPGLDALKARLALLLALASDRVDLLQAWARGGEP